MTTKFPRLFERTKLRKHAHNQKIEQSSLQTGSIAIISIPPGGEIFIDNTDKGVKSSAIISDIDISITPIHILKLVMDGYEDYIYEFTLSDGSIDTHFALPIPTNLSTQTGNLSVTSILDNTEFMAITMSTGVETTIGEAGQIAPQTFNNIPAGIYGYETHVAGPPEYVSMGSFEILPGHTTSLSLSLGSTDPTLTGALIESIPSGADIYIDGNSLSAKTSLLRSFIPENHTYELRMSGYQTKTGSFTPVLDIQNIISETLLPTGEQAGSDSGSIILVAGVAALGLMMSKTK